MSDLKAKTFANKIIKVTLQKIMKKSNWYEKKSIPINDETFFLPCFVLLKSERRD